MRSLQGKPYSSGAIEFSYAENDWAANWYEKNAEKLKDTRRIEINPNKVALVVNSSEDSNPDDYGWLDRVQTILDSADRVYLRVLSQCFRFQRAVHKISDTREIVTLGTQTDVESYARKHWDRIKYFFCNRYDGFSFEIKKMVTYRKDSDAKLRSMDLITRVGTKSGEETSQLSFLATGSGASNEIINWRNSIAEGAGGRFDQDELQIRIKIGQFTQPLTFLHEVRQEFNNDSYEFEGDQLKREIAKIFRQHEEQKQQDSPDP